MRLLGSCKILIKLFAVGLKKVKRLERGFLDKMVQYESIKNQEACHVELEQGTTGRPPRP